MKKYFNIFGRYKGLAYLPKLFSKVRSKDWLEIFFYLQRNVILETSLAIILNINQTLVLVLVKKKKSRPER